MYSNRRQSDQLPTSCPRGQTGLHNYETALELASKYDPLRQQAEDKRYHSLETGHLLLFPTTPLSPKDVVGYRPSHQSTPVSVTRRWCCRTMSQLYRFVHSSDAPACNISGREKDAREQYIFRSYSTSTLNAMRFDENPFTCRCEKEGKKA